MLIEHGAGPDPKGMYGETPLAGAALYGHAAVVKLLLDLNVDIEFKDAYGYGQTALDHAVANGHQESVNLLRGCANTPVETKIESSGDLPPYSVN